MPAREVALLDDAPEVVEPAASALRPLDRFPLQQIAERPLLTCLRGGVQVVRRVGIVDDQRHREHILVTARDENLCQTLARQDIEHGEVMPPRQWHEPSAKARFV